MAAGTYRESVTLDKAVVIKGAKAGIHGDGTRPGTPRRIPGKVP
ncbi:hypothetical protein AB5I41_07800 [Sphingomonas sp. MMS24-JH45]